MPTTNDLYLLGFVVLGSLLCFWPHASDHVLPNTILEEISIVGGETQGISYVMIALAIPFVIDAILDAWKKRNDEEMFLTFMEKFLLSVGFSVTPAYTIYAASSSSFGNVVLNDFMLKRFLAIVVVGTTWTSLTRLYCTYFPRVLFYVGFGSLCIGLLTALISDVCDMNFYPAYVVVISSVFKYVGILTFLCLMFHWIVRTCIKSWRSTVMPSSAEMSYGFSNIFFPMFYISTCFKGKYEDGKNIETSNSSRKSYLRYVAHELRTPLNSAALGMNWLVTSLMSIEDRDDLDEELLETASDVSKTLEVAVGIMSDLMTINKIECGIFALHKQEVLVKKYISECVGCFAAEAREKGIKMEIVNFKELMAPADTYVSSVTSAVMRGDRDRRGSIERSMYHNAIDISENDAAEFDKFKMDQVLRNLISNALIFSPRDGQIKISAGFNPKIVQPLNRNTSMLLSRASSLLNRVVQNRMSSKKSVMTSGKESARNMRASLRVVNSMTKKFFLQRRNSVADSPINVSINEEIIGDLVIVVQDGGCGISKEHQSKIFQEGIQLNPDDLKGRGNTNGSGFGLFISKSIVELHGGNIEVFSLGEGKGSTFTFTIPMKRSNSKNVDGPLPPATSPAIDPRPRFLDASSILAERALSFDRLVPPPPGLTLSRSRSRRNISRASFTLTSTGRPRRPLGYSSPPYPFTAKRLSNSAALPANQSYLDSNSVPQSIVDCVVIEDGNMDRIFNIDRCSKDRSNSDELYVDPMHNGVTTGGRAAIPMLSTIPSLSNFLHSPADTSPSIISASPEPGVRMGQDAETPQPRQCPPPVRLVMEQPSPVDTSRAMEGKEEQKVNPFDETIHGGETKKSSQATSSLKDRLDLKIDSAIALVEGVEEQLTSLRTYPSPREDFCLATVHNVTRRSSFVDNLVNGDGGDSLAAAVAAAMAVAGGGGGGIAVDVFSELPSKLVIDNIKNMGGMSRQSSMMGGTSQRKRTPRTHRRTSDISAGQDAATKISYHILVVDDSGMSRKMLMKTLKNEGHTTEEAEDGLVAVGKVKDKGSTTYDAILVDFVMPVMDGPTATKSIRELGYTGPIIGCTGNTLDMDVQRFKECGCDHVMGKPFRMDEFAQHMLEFRATLPTDEVITDRNEQE